MKHLIVLLVLAFLACPAAVAGDSPWTLRFHGAVVQSSARHEAAVGSGVVSRVDGGASGGIGLGAEFRISEQVGLELSWLSAPLEIVTRASAGGASAAESLQLSMAPLTLGLPIHFAVGRRADLFFAPTISRVSYSDTTWSVSHQNVSSTVDVRSDTAPGAALGLDAGFGSGGWAFSAGLRYMKTEARGTDIDPLIMTIGFAYRF